MMETFIDKYYCKVIIDIDELKGSKYLKGMYLIKFLI